MMTKKKNFCEWQISQQIPILTNKAAFERVKTEGFKITRIRLEPQSSLFRGGQVE